MVSYTCDKCKKLVPEMGYFRAYSHSKHKEVGLCRPCSKKLKEAIEKADADFFKGKGE